MCTLSSQEGLTFDQNPCEAENYNAITRDRAFGLSLLEEFQDRLCFATDIAHMTQNLPIVEFFKRRRSQRLLFKEALTKITSRNAARLLGLGLG